MEKIPESTMRERLAKPEQKLVLRIIDDGTAIANLLSLDSFLCAFEIIRKLATELNHLASALLVSAFSQPYRKHPDCMRKFILKNEPI